MLGTRAQALAPITLQRPDEADPAIAMVAAFRSRSTSTSGPAAAAQDHAAAEGQGQIDRAPSLIGFLAGRHGTPSTQIKRVRKQGKQHERAHEIKRVAPSAAMFTTEGDEDVASGLAD